MVLHREGVYGIYSEARVMGLWRFGMGPYQLEKGLGGIVSQSYASMVTEE